MPIEQTISTVEEGQATRAEEGRKLLPREEYAERSRLWQVHEGLDELHGQGARIRPLEEGTLDRLDPKLADLERRLQATWDQYERDY